MMIKLSPRVQNSGRKSTILLFIIALFISSLGLWLCSGKNPNHIVVWHSLRPLEREVLRAVLEKFAKDHPDWQFSELFYDPESARTNFIISALGGSGPALLRGANDNIGPLAELGVIRPLDDFFAQTMLDSFITDPLHANTYFDDHLYQIADRIGNHLCLVYNKALISTPPTTMTELIDIGKKLTMDKNGDGKIDQYALVWNYTEPFFAAPFIGGFGGWIVDEHNRPTLNTAPVVKAAQFIYDLATVFKIIPPECDYEIANALFKDGSAAMIINGSWSWGTYIENGIDIGLARIPMVDETNLWPTPAVQPMGYSINVNLKNEKLAITVALLKYLTSSDVQLRFTAVSRAIPARKDAYNSPLVQENEMVKASLDQLLVGRVTPPVTELRWIWDAMRPGYQAIFTGQQSPQQAAAGMQKLAEKLIRENRE
ncbi:extracellular solute-binding protein [candidate division KSB1 bacterium]|nr:extracellular solute-binding protein [candidate division KSB1 bacterium]RQW04115.1 MAG: extracellular solute-binding protein [candidate division KSB1 bacterium]